MRITMIAMGSTGDVKPYIAFGHELKRRGHEVTVAAFSGFEDMIAGAGLKPFTIAGDVKEMMANIMSPSSKGVTYLYQVDKSLNKVAPVTLRDLMASCADADAMICAFFGTLFYSIAEYYHIPCIQTQYYPMDPSELTAISSFPVSDGGRWINALSYKIGYLLIGVVEKHLLADWREAHGMPPRRPTTRPDYTSDGHRVPVIYATSPLVMPRPENWDEHIYQTGFWFDENEPAWEPPDALRGFMESGEPPVYIGFGSMNSGDMQRTYTQVIRAVHGAGIRAVINTGWGGGESAFVSNNRVWFAEAIPHSWLFPRVKAVVHHGGCGTTAAGLKAGKPTLIIPFGGDQPYWGRRVAAIGCGPKPIPRTALTARKLTSALMDLTCTPAYADNARRVAEGIAREGGVRAAADIAEAEIAAWHESTDKDD